MVTNLDVLDQLSSCNDNTGTLVATNKRQLGGQWPVTVHGVQISVAHTGVLDVDKNLIWAWLLNWNLLVLDWSAGLLNDLRPLLGWDLW
jgi:hypothetical protein